MASYAEITHSMERGAIAEHFTSVGADSARNTTSPIAGSVDFALNYPSGAGITWNTSSNCVQPTLSFTQRKTSIFFKFKFNNTPAALGGDFGQLGQKILTLDTTRKIKFDTILGSTVYSTGTIYCCEAIADKDWVLANSGALLVRIYDSTHTTLLDSYEVDLAGSSFNAAWVFGGVTLKALTGPNVKIQMDEFIQWYSDTTVTKAPWLNLQTTQTIRVPTVIGNYNDFTGVGDATNKYNNVDENPNNSTDFNNDGERGVTRRQTFTFTNVASYANTIRGWSVTDLVRGSPGQILSGDVKQLVRFSSVDYTVTMPVTISSVYAPVAVGYPGLPDGTTAITATDLNNMEVGEYILTTDTNYNNGYSDKFLPTADGATYDGNWTVSSGSASAYTVIDDGAVDDDTDYLEINTINLKQGITITGNITPLTDIGDTIYQIRADVRSRANTGTSGSIMKIGFRTGGVDYDADSSFLNDPSTTVFSDDSFNLTFSGSVKNPATSAYFTKAQIESYEWYFYVSTLGTGPTQVSNFSLFLYTASNIVSTALFMEVHTGDAYTDNGNVLFLKRQLIVKQAVNRGGTY